LRGDKHGTNPSLVKLAEFRLEASVKTAIRHVSLAYSNHKLACFPCHASFDILLVPQAFADTIEKGGMCNIRIGMQSTNQRINKSINQPILMVGFNRRFAPHQTIPGIPGHGADACRRPSNLSQLLNFLTSHPLFSPGDRVVSNRPHAEMLCVPKSLYARYS